MARTRASFCLAYSLRATISCCCRFWNSTRERSVSMAGLSPAFCWSVALPYSACAVSNCASAVSTRAAPGERLQIGIAGRQHHQLAGILVAVLRGPLVFRRSALAVQSFKVQDRLGKVHPGVSKSVGPNHRGKSGEAQPAGSQVVLHHIYADRATDVGEKLAQFLPFLLPGRRWSCNSAAALRGYFSGRGQSHPGK